MEKQKALESPKIKLSVALATFNEEKNIVECLKSIKGLADEIIVVDGSSIDNTVKVAESLGAKVYVTDNKPIFHINKQQAIDNCKGEWILQLDADETVPSELRDEIKTVITNLTSNDAYYIKRKKMFLGRWMKKGGQYPDPVIRLFKNKKAHLPCKSVHEQMTVDGSIGWLTSELIHLPTTSFSQYLIKDDRYSTLTAEEMKQRNVPITVFSFIKYVFWRPLKTFSSIYFRHRGFLDGFPGFVFAFYSGLHHLTAYVKYWEMKNASRN